METLFNWAWIIFERTCLWGDWLEISEYYAETQSRGLHASIWSGWVIISPPGSSLFHPPPVENVVQPSIQPSIHPSTSSSLSIRFFSIKTTGFCSELGFPQPIPSALTSSSVHFVRGCVFDLAAFPPTRPLTNPHPEQPAPCDDWLGSISSSLVYV